MVTRCRRGRLAVTEFLAERLGESADGELAAHVGGEPGCADVGVDRGVVDEHPVALVAEPGQYRTGPVGVAEEVGLQHPPEGRRWDCLQRAEQVDTGVVDPDVDPTEPLDRTSGQLGDCCLVGDISGYGQGLAAGRLALPCQLLEGAGPSCGHYYPCSAFGECKPGCPADPAGGAGDHDHRTVEPLSHADHPLSQLRTVPTWPGSRRTGHPSRWNPASSTTAATPGSSRS